MRTAEWKALLEQVSERALTFLESLPDRRVGASASGDELRAALGGELPEDPVAPGEVLNGLADAAEPGLVATPGGRFFGFVIGGSVPAALAADMLAVAWDQNAGLYAATPAAAVVEEVVAGWLVDLFGLPSDTSVGFVTGGMMANFTCLAAARHGVLRRAGWDVEADGLQGAPRVRVLVGAERHNTIDRALRFLGLGRDGSIVVDADEQGRMRPDALRAVLDDLDARPTIICTQAGNVNSGAFDPIGEVSDLAHERDAWVHVDGAFGLWATTAPSLRGQTSGIERADSWSTDAHKWLNVPHDSGVALVRHPQDHRGAMGIRASYLVHQEGADRDAMEWNPEASRRARGFAVYAALRSLGRSGVADLVERSCALARRFAERLTAHDGVEVLNDVVLNQVVVRFLHDGGDHDDLTRAVVTAIQDEGTLWASGTTWRGVAGMRISVSNWSTDEEDVDRSVDAIVRCLAAERERRRQ